MSTFFIKIFYVFKKSNKITVFISGIQKIIIYEYFIILQNLIDNNKIYLKFENVLELLSLACYIKKLFLV